MDTKFAIRSCQNDEDFWRIRCFLREVFLLNDRQERCWHVARLDYWRWHFIQNCEVCDPVDEVTTIWETPDDQIAAVLHPSSKGDAFLHVHPGFCTSELVEEMVSYSEEHLAVINDKGRRRLTILADEGDTVRQSVLKQRGFARRPAPVRRWWRDLDVLISEAPVAPGYIIRSMGDEAEFPARSWASWRAFHPDEPDEAYEGWQWYHSIQSAPLYRRDLDIVAATPAGEIAAFCLIWFDDVTRSAVCVLVGTAPEHQRRGLGKAMIAEGLNRLKRIGGTRVFANGYDTAANALYSAVLGARELTYFWVKTF
jgi:GNAT superfamily N-acetyltransferase